jgi:hypothetical protein
MKESLSVLYNFYFSLEISDESELAWVVPLTFCRLSEFNTGKL